MPGVSITIIFWGGIGSVTPILLLKLLRVLHGMTKFFATKLYFIV